MSGSGEHALMLLRDAISIPTEIQQGDLVFRLADAEDHAAETVSSYVVTPQLLEAFDEAVALLRSAVDEGVSKAAFLSGSFGAGKSNFMGVLQLLLEGNTAALAKPELAPVVAKLRPWQGDRRFLTVPFHLIGARTLESAIFGGYVSYLRKHHPDAPMPEVFADEPLLENADTLRATMGDEAFFTALGGADADDGWGDLSGWDAERYDRARIAAVGDAERGLLVQSLLDTLLSGFAQAAAANAAGFVDIDAGLAAVSRHAQGLGYAGVILFLDELILWLLSRMADVAFATGEASKISKLVEGATGDRPVPIISLIARQRDLRELVGSEVPGLEKMAFVDQLDYQMGRFSNITLNDSNLPVVAHHRLLRPSSDEGAAALATAFADLQLTASQRDVLCGEFGGVEAFQLTYPFSPAFLQIVVDVAGALQRTRTGLRVLLQLLVEGRDRLTVGDLVPVGELYDVLASSEDPLTEEMKASFGQAKRLYATRLRPLLLATHGLAEHDEPTPAFLTDDRLVKSLLLAALVPTSAAFKDLTAARLVALNHGLITSPVPGSEINVVVNKLRGWASQTSELQLGTDPHDPTVAIVLSDVDTRAILDVVKGNDNTGSRRQLIRDLIVDELGLPEGQMAHSLRQEWKGVRREVDVRFGNVRDPENLAESAFADDGRWKVIIDFPFDDEGHGPHEDLHRLEELRANGRSWKTIAWLPSFFTAQTLTVLGDLVKLNFLLATADRYNDATKNLSPTARAAARPQLEAQQVAARQRLGHAVRMAYGVVAADPATIDSSHSLADHFPSLQAGLTIRPPVAADMAEALADVVSQAFAHSYPAAPALEREARTADLRKVFEVVQAALDHPDGRLPHVPTAERNLMRGIANPLRLGTQSEQAFVVDGVAGYWDNRFTKRLSEQGAGGRATVADLRRWIDEPEPMGLTRPLQDLVLVSWAAATNRAFRDHGGPARVGIDQLGDHLEVVAQPLPSAAVWGVARDRAERIFGVPHLPDAPSANGLARLSAALVDRSDDARAEAAALPGELEELARLVSEGRAERARITTARSAHALLEAIVAAADDLTRCEALAAADITPSPEAVGTSIATASAVLAGIRSVDKALLASALARAEGAPLAVTIETLLDTDELAIPLGAELASTYESARALVLSASTTAAVERSTSVAPTAPPPPGARLVEVAFGDIAEAERRLAELRERLNRNEVRDLEIAIHYVEVDDPR